MSKTEHNSEFAESIPCQEIPKNTGAKIKAELFHSYLVDSRGELVNKSKTHRLKEDNQLRFFCSDMEDPIRTNMDACGYIGNDDTFVIESIRIGIKLSNRDHFPEFVRATRFFLYIGDKPYAPIEASLLADPDVAHGVSWHHDTVEPTEFQVDLWAEKQLERQICILPRQSFYVLMNTYNIFSDRMREIEDGKIKECAEIRVTLCSTRITHNPEKIEKLLEELGQDTDPTQDQEAKFFTTNLEDGESKKWDPTDYLKTKKN